MVETENIAIDNLIENVKTVSDVEGEIDEGYEENETEVLG